MYNVVMRYNKLVRDKIPQVIQRKGETAVTHIAEDAEFWEKLKEKLFEEVEEFSNDESIEELADIFEVIDAIMEYKKWDRSEIEAVKQSKVHDKGAFKERVILDEA